MKKLLLLISCCFLTALSTHAQVFKKADPIICPADPASYDTFVPPPQKFRDAQFKRSAGTTEIIVNYNGFTEEAKAAYQHAVDIWASLLKSPVQIIVNANFSDLGEGVLGSAGPSNYVKDFAGAPLADTYYPIGLAEKIAGENLNGSNEADINSNFSSTFDFYFGLDGNPPANQYDFVTIVLHELGHGLGFTGGVSFDDDNSSWSIGTSGLPTIYTRFVELGNGDSIISVANNSAETADALTSNNLFFNGPYAVAELGSRPRLYVPSSWNQGSSYSHLDESTYLAGDPNSLMTPQAGSGEAIHDPGVSLDIFADMGWIHTYLDHTNTHEITDNITDPFQVELSVKSDTVLSNLAPVVVYSTDDFATTQSVTMTDQGDGVNFEAQIPNPETFTSIKYYFEGVADVLGRTYNSPQNSPDQFYEINILDIKQRAVPYLAADGGDFESSQGDFQSIALDGGVNVWEYGTPANRLNESVSGENVWKTNLGSNIGENGKGSSSALLSPTFDFSDDTKNHELSFDFQMENAYTEEIGLFESGPFGLQVQYSTDKGGTWELLGDINDDAGTNWYNASESDPTVFPQDANAGWIQQTIEVAEGDTTFVPIKAKYNVSFLTGFNNVNFRIVFHATDGFIDKGYEADGVLIDDFEILKSNPTAEFTSTSPKFVYAGDNVEFKYLSSGANSFAWDFGDGNTSTLENPTHAYADGGTYTISLTVTSPDGNATVTKEDYVSIVNTREIPYGLADGGDLEGTHPDFIIDNKAGTGFEIGKSSIEGKAGTASGDNAFVTGINDSIYQNYSEAYIYSPEFNFESLGNYELSFETNYNFEDNWDGFILEYTLDRGENWIKLNDEKAEGWYNQISDPQSVFGNQTPIFSGNTGNAFEKKQTDISFLGGKGKVLFRVKFLSDAAEARAGMAIDNFKVKGPEPGPAVPDFIASSPSACDGTTIVFSNKSEGSIKTLNWNFGAGAEPETASGVGPHEVTYAEPGAYTVKLSATDFSDGLVTEQKETYILIEKNHTPTITVSERDSDDNVTLTASEGNSYQWFYKGNMVQDATSKELVVQTSGDYSVAVTINGCEGVSENTLVLSNDSPLSRSFSAFPNPLNNSNQLNILFENDYYGNYTIEIYSLTGHRVLSESFTKASTKEEQAISLDNATKGLYLIRVTTGNQSTQSKILIE